MGLAELGVKLVLFGLHPSPKILLVPSTDPVRVYELRPNLHETFTYLNPQQRDWPFTVTTNAHGFRGTRLDAARARTPRVLVLGDSYAFGFGVDDDAPFPRVLDERLGPEVEVVNAGVPGYNLLQSVRLLETQGVTVAPRLVVLALHTNDAEPPVFADANQVRWALRSHLYSLWLHREFLYGADIEVALARDRRERLTVAQQALERLARLAAERGFELLVFRVSCISGLDGPVDELLLLHARRGGIETLAPGPSFCALLARHSIPDDGHPDRAGHALLARELEPPVQRMLRAPGERSPASPVPDGAP